jgi:hypothetical protein
MPSKRRKAQDDLEAIWGEYDELWGTDDEVSSLSATDQSKSKDSLQRGRRFRSTESKLLAKTSESDASDRASSAAATKRKVLRLRPLGTNKSFSRKKVLRNAAVVYYTPYLHYVHTLCIIPRYLHPVLTH